ncbi:MAG: oligosaccharide flippase family protein [Acidaminococcaceae bacterium]|nr:oligosaccharide flippase family protein [Acidaminococcaceae bacterium]
MIMNKFLQKYNSFNIQVKAAFWFTMCSFFQKGISFVTVPLFTRLMTVEQYGTFTLYLSWLQVFTVFSTLYLFNGVTDNAMSKFEDDRERFISSMQGLTITVTTCVMALVFFFWRNIKIIMGLTPVMILLMFIEIYVTPALAFWSGKQRFEYRYKRLVSVTVLKSLLNPFLGLLAVYFSSDKALARIISTVVVEVLICGSIMIMQFSSGKLFYDKQYWKYAVTLAVPLLPHYLAGIILSHGDRIMISKLCGTGEVALYGVAYNIGMIILLFVAAINSSLTPWIYSKLKLKGIESIQQRSRGVLFFIFCVALGLMLVSPEIVLIFGSSKYANAVNVIPPVAGSVYFIFLYNFLSFPEFYFEKTSFLMWASIIAAGLNVVLNYIFIPVYGFIAAAYTTLACYVIYSLGHYFVGGKILHLNTGYSTIIDRTVAIILSVSIILIAVSVHFTFEWMLVRYLIIAISFMCVFLKRKDIMKLLTEKS